MNDIKKLPRYRCKKEVSAVKIKEVKPGPTTELYIIIPEDKGYHAFYVTFEYILRYQPIAGGYYVRDDDGCESFSMSDAFDAEYIKLESLKCP